MALTPEDSAALRALGLEPSRVVHVLPTYGREHVDRLLGDGCWCCPKVEVGLGSDKRGALIVHREEN